MPGGGGEDRIGPGRRGPDVPKAVAAVLQFSVFPCAVAVRVQ